MHDCLTAGHDSAVKGRSDAHRAGPCSAGAFCAQVVQRLRLQGEDLDQQVVRQVRQAAWGPLQGCEGIDCGRCGQHFRTVLWDGAKDLSTAGSAMVALNSPSAATAFTPTRSCLYMPHTGRIDNCRTEHVSHVQDTERHLGKCPAP